MNKKSITFAKSAQNNWGPVKSDGDNWGPRKNWGGARRGVPKGRFVTDCLWTT